MTVSHALGEITWLLSQSRNHRDITVGDLNWLVMPAILHRQFHIFRDGERPVGVALWALLGEVGERKMLAGLRAKKLRLEEREWRAGDRLWLIEFIAPFATELNRHAELMMADLVTGPLSGRGFSMLRVDPVTLDAHVIQVPSSAGIELVGATKQALAELVSSR
ncbi:MULTISPECIES: toxin-activating lysine-acyltransferase [unclassified Sphingopyxis]|uniref:toxin-activating lysine-acyltransferase n=1 Tax=unclassified Sphingopyxis TaxID=2614943 RepID=UPI0007313111|nr:MULTISPECIES: toxin-activating lysine-acyltransferase [unclassified Sphingopyxis]KTE53585.1 hypothetical protein ATE64_06855 [Sphingopyxis sp. H073]KTE61871.1 hypothetical protein ATE66_03695 [Sphingopyxis sp. H107]KTE67144.1 hypothetical protein ATE65_03700 [Sphingopyxis sp. H100]KTE74584.1 hypothetical protein ATE60_00760 [Sphingopyxis sp. H081]KTE81637.1 hypothetical protein ATE63_06225 [Sphingopyxis sp. H067]